MNTHSWFSHTFIGNSVILTLCRVLELQDETDTDLGLLELTVSGRGRHWTPTPISTSTITYGISALKGNDRGGLGPPGKASMKR